MLRLSNINIRFDRDLIVDGAIDLLDGRITAIIGESGSGKSTLLYHIGLISSNDQYHYQLDGNSIDLTSDVVTSELRKKRIGFIFQDNNLIDNLTIKENIILSASIANIPISDKNVRDYMDYVELPGIHLNHYPRRLSGGEQQRAALACVLAKQPDIIVADEPTSALDTTNSQRIMKILRRMAHEDSKKVIIASHNAEIYNQADVIYEIKNTKLNPVKGADLLSLTHQDTTTNQVASSRMFGLGFFYNYAKKSARKHHFQKSLMTTICAIAIAFSAAAFNFGEAFIEGSEALIEQMSSREVYISNMASGAGRVLYDEANMPVDAQEAEALAKIVQLDSIYPFIEFRSFSHQRAGDLSTISVNGREYNFNIMNTPPYDVYSLLPYFPEQNLDNRLEIASPATIQDPIYISAQFAEVLEIDSLAQDVVLNVQACIPTGDYQVAEATVDEEGSAYSVKLDEFVVENFKFQVAGVLDDLVTNQYTDHGNNVIFIPHSLMMEILNETQSQHGQPEDEWFPSFYVAYAKSYNLVQQLRDSVATINPNFRTASEYQDINARNSLIGNVRQVALSVVLVVLVIIFLLMAIIHTNNMMSRKYEISLLKANGLTRAELTKLILTESGIQVLTIAGLATLVSLLLILAVNFMFSFAIINLGISILVINLLVSLVAVVMPTIISLVIVNRYQPDRIMRN
ncbi:MAG: ATP-binding cassette domain-containing protein [Firmicutes bacterium]|nr:ATP-binding cassette domain-containing protein [Bacillota bacterium]